MLKCFFNDNYNTFAPCIAHLWKEICINRANAVNFDTIIFWCMIWRRDVWKVKQKCSKSVSYIHVILLFSKVFHITLRCNNTHNCLFFCGLIVSESTRTFVILFYTYNLSCFYSIITNKLVGAVRISCKLLFFSTIVKLYD